MKRIFAILAAVVLLASCTNKNTSNTPKDGQSLGEVVEAVRSDFCEKYSQDDIVVMPMEVDDEYLTDMVGLAKDDIDESAGWIALTMTNSDAFFAVHANDGKIEAVTEALSAYLKSLVAQYERYSVACSYERAQAGKVYVKGDYAFFIVVGMDPDDDFATDIYPEQVQFVMDSIDDKFN